MIVTRQEEEHRPVQVFVVQSSDTKWDALIEYLAQYGAADVRSVSPQLLLWTTSIPELRNALDVCSAKASSVPLSDPLTVISSKAQTLPVAEREWIEALILLTLESNNRPLIQTVLKAGPLKLDLLHRVAVHGEREIPLGKTEFRLLEYFLRRPNKIISRATLLREVWSYKILPRTNLVDVHMGKIRRKIDGGNKVKLFRSLRGLGFVLDVPNEDDPAGRL